MVIGILSMFVLNTGYQSTEAKTELDLTKLAAILQDEFIMINEWSLHTREKTENLQSLKEVTHFTHQLKKQYPHWSWTEKTSGSHMETVAVHKSNTHKETIKILSTPTKGGYQTYVIYEVNGHKWDDSLEKEISQLVQGRISDIFRENTTIFSCLKGEFNGKIDKTLPEELNRLQAAFHAEKIEALSEQQFISMSAYSTMFDQTVETNGKNMNLQIGIRDQGLGGKTTVVVGTPILTIEY